MAKPAKSKKAPTVQLTRKAMKKVKGGTGNFVKLDGIKGESLDDKHKG